MKSITGNLNLSLLEILSVILPGATGLFFLNKLEILNNAINSILSEKSEWIEGIIYFGASYFLGYVIYIASSGLDNLYDKIKRKALELDTKEGKKKGLQFLPIDKNKIKNPLYRVLFPHLVDTHNLIVKVVGFKNRDIGADLDGHKHQIIDAYQYSYRRLMAEQTTMFAEVERYYGTARFFRCMTVVLFFGSIIWLIYDNDEIVSLWIFIFSIISFFVFLNRWRKANHVAFKNVIILEGMHAQK